MKNKIYQKNLELVDRDKRYPIDEAMTVLA